MKAKRIVFKVGTSSLTNPDGSLSRQKVKVITQQLALLHESGHELILVSSGAVAAGFGALGFKKRPTKVADKQALVGRFLKPRAPNPAATAPDETKINS